jgi:hypothetical protein
LDKFFIEFFGFPVSTIPPWLHTHHHLGAEHEVRWWSQFGDSLTPSTKKKAPAKRDAMSGSQFFFMISHSMNDRTR